MKLEQVHIKNYRSIADLEFNFDINCKILVGINEVGKSNILRALSLLDESAEIDSNDRREPLEDEPYDETSNIDFLLKFDAHEIRLLCDAVKKKLLTFEPNPTIMKYEKKDISFIDFLKKKSEVLYRVNICSKERKYLYYSISDGYTINNVKKVSAACPQTYNIELTKGIINLKDYKFVCISDIEIPEEYLEDIEPDDINDLFGLEALNIAKNNPKNVIYWKYDDKYLLPHEVIKQNFMNNPDSCVPLKHMFKLAKIDDIKASIESANTRKNGFKNLLNKVQNITTKHFKSVWKEYKDLEFELSPDGDKINISVKDYFNNYDLQQRSDGFKRFVTFLLMISAKERTQNLKNTLIIVDEPEISLHPKGARYLRDELIKLSEHNYVVYSTHSIFMIDKERIDRHYEVKKVHEKTIVNQLSYSDYFEEEVVFNALGCSMFEIMKDQNIVFEGWKDKKLFITAMSKIPNDYKELRTKFKDVGLAHSKGVTAIHSTTVNMELTNRKCLILSDNDEMAIKHKKEYEDEHYYGDWYTYRDIQEDCEAKTGEDFLKDTLIIKSVKNIMQNHPDIDDVTTLNLIDSKGKIHAIQNWLKGFGYSKETSRPIVKEIKDEVFKNIKVSDVEDSYYKLLENLARLL